MKDRDEVDYRKYDDGMVSPYRLGATAKHNPYLCYADALTCQGCDLGRYCWYRHCDLTQEEIVAIESLGGEAGRHFLFDYMSAWRRRHWFKRDTQEGRGLPVAPLEPDNHEEAMELEVHKEWLGTRLPPSRRQAEIRDFGRPVHRTGSSTRSGDTGSGSVSSHRAETVWPWQSRHRIRDTERRRAFGERNRHQSQD